MKKQQTVWQRRFQKLGYIGLMLLAVNFAYQIWDRYIDKSPHSHKRAKCDLRKKACKVVLSDDREIEFAVNPRKIPTDKSITFTVQLTNMHPNDVVLSISALGVKQPAKNLVMASLGTSFYKVEAQLDNIYPSHHEWLALVHIRTDEQNIAIPFKFKS